MPFQVSPKRHVLVVSCQGWVRDGRQFYTEVTESGEGPWQPLSEMNQGVQSMQLLRFDEQRSRTVCATEALSNCPYFGLFGGNVRSWQRRSSS